MVSTGNVTPASPHETGAVSADDPSDESENENDIRWDTSGIPDEIAARPIPCAMDVRPSMEHVDAFPNQYFPVDERTLRSHLLGSFSCAVDRQCSIFPKPLVHHATDDGIIVSPCKHPIKSVVFQMRWDYLHDGANDVVDSDCVGAEVTFASVGKPFPQFLHDALLLEGDMQPFEQSSNSGTDIWNGLAPDAPSTPKIIPPSPRPFSTAYCILQANSCQPVAPRDSNVLEIPTGPKFNARKTAAIRTPLDEVSDLLPTLVVGQFASAVQASAMQCAACELMMPIGVACCGESTHVK